MNYSIIFSIYADKQANCRTSARTLGSGFGIRSVLSYHRYGFTLAELIVVITILAILATVGFLSLSEYASDARDARMKANVRSVRSAIAAESALS